MVFFFMFTCNTLTYVDRREQPKYVLYFGDHLVNVSMTLYIVANFFSGYYLSKKKIIILSYKKITFHYMKTYFWSDLAEILIDTYGYCVNDYRKLIFIPDFFMVMRLIRLPTFIVYLNEIQEWCNVPYHIATSIKLFLLVLICLIWGTFFVSVFGPQILIGKERKLLNFLTTLKKVTVLIFLVNQEFHLSQETIGFMLVKVLGMFIGVVLQIAIGVTVVRIYKLLTNTYASHKNLQNSINSYLKKEGAPLKLKKRVTQFVDFKYNGEFIQETEFLSILPPSLQTSIKENLTMRLMKNTAFYHLLTKQCLYSMINKMQLHICLKHDIVFTIGSTDDFLYFVHTGTVAIFSKNGDELAHFGQGSYFGEFSVILGLPRTATVVAITECKLYKLSRSDFMESLLPYPELVENLMEFTKKRYAALLKDAV